MKLHELECPPFVKAPDPDLPSLPLHRYLRVPVPLLCEQDNVVKHGIYNTFGKRVKPRVLECPPSVKVPIPHLPSLPLHRYLPRRVLGHGSGAGSGGGCGSGPKP